MGSHYYTNPLEFLINTLFGLYVLALMLRLLLAAVKADFYNPISQFLVKVTNPLLVPMRRFVPSIGRIDTSAVVLMLLVQMVAITLILVIRGGGFSPVVLVFWSLVELVDLLFNVFIFSIVIQAVLSWVSPGTYSPVSGLLYSLTEPVLRPFRRMIPPISGLDLSPMAALISLYVLKLLVMPPLYHLLRV